MKGNWKKKRKETDKNISEAFEDLSKLMVKAKEMVELSKSIANKIKDKQGDITEDETIRFKSYLLSMGIANPVTRKPTAQAPSTTCSWPNSWLEYCRRL